MIKMLAAQNWGLFVLRGILAILIGILAFVVPGPTLAAAVLVFGAYATVDGIVAVGAGFGAPGGTRWWIVAAGGLMILFGLYALFLTGITELALVLTIGVFSVIRGVGEIVTAVRLRKMIEGEWLYILSGAVAVIFGGYLLVSPGTGALAVVWLIGYYAMFAGIMYLMVGWRLRGVAKPA